MSKEKVNVPKDKTPKVKVLDESAHFEHICGVPSVQYRQNGVYFGADKKERSLPAPDTRTKAELDLETALARIKELEQENAEHVAAQAKRNLVVVSPPAPVEEEELSTEVISVDVVDDEVVTTTKDK